MHDICKFIHGDHVHKNKPLQWVLFFVADFFGNVLEDSRDYKFCNRNVIVLIIYPSHVSFFLLLHFMWYRRYVFRLCAHQKKKKNFDSLIQTITIQHTYNKYRLSDAFICFAIRCVFVWKIFKIYLVSDVNVLISKSSLEIFYKNILKNV